MNRRMRALPQSAKSRQWHLRKNPDRLTSEVNVEAWFGWNSNMLLKSECTLVEKGDLITWPMTIK